MRLPYVLDGGGERKKNRPSEREGKGEGPNLRTLGRKKGIRSC